LQYIVLAHILKITLNHTIKMLHVHIPIQLPISLFVNVFFINTWEYIAELWIL